MKLNQLNSQVSQIKVIHNSKKYLNTYTYFVFFFGYDYLYQHKSVVVRSLRKIYCITVALVTSIYVLHNLDYSFAAPYVIIVVEYLMNVASSCISNKSHRDKFFHNMELIDAKLGVSISYYKKLTKIHYVIALVATITRLSYIFSFCYFYNKVCIDGILKLLTAGYILLAVDYNQLPRVILFSMVRFRMKLLRQNMERHFHLSSINFLTKDEYSKLLRKSLWIYKDLVDSVDNISRPMNPLYFMSLVFSFPKIMLLIYNILLHSKTGGATIGQVMMSLEAFQVGLLPCLPGIVTEMILSETDRIKLMLMHRLLWTFDERERFEIGNFLSYLEHRPFKYRIWRLIPVDLSLPVGLFSLCTTYLIVLIQFTHIFE